MERLQEAWESRHQSEADFNHARNGDHLLIPFECTLCVFRKLKRREPMSCNPQDTLLKECIMRAVLDAFWSRSSITVKGYACKATQMVGILRLVGLDGPFSVVAPLPSYDHFGYEVVVEILLYSRQPGRHTDHMQYDTIQSFRAVYSNFVQASPQSNLQPWSLGAVSGRYSRFGADPCGSLLFTWFMEGMKGQIGQIWLSNQALRNDLRDESTR